jgi:hypothetical protein
VASVPVGLVDFEGEEELSGVSPKGLFELGEGDVELGEDNVELGIETVGDIAGDEVEGAALIGLVVVEPRRARISESVAAHATGIPSFQTVSVGLGFTVEKL